MQRTKELVSQADRAATLLRSAHRSGDGDIDTAVYRSVAEHVLAARQLFTTKEGRPDWRGVTYAYRQWYGDMLGSSGIPSEDLPRVQSALRYHVGNLLRERLDDAELEAIGLRSASPRQRSLAKRSQELEILNLFTGGEPIGDPETVRRLIGYMASAARRVEPEALDAALDADEGQAFLKDFAEAIRKGLRGRRRGGSVASGS